MDEKPRLSLVPRTSRPEDASPDPPETEQEESPEPDDQHKPIFIVNRVKWHEAATQLMRILLKQNDPPTLFQRGDGLVEVSTEPLIVDDVVTPAGTLTKTTKAHLTKRMEESIRCVKESARGELTETHLPPGPAASALLDAGKYGFPVLRGVAHAPIMLKNGDVLDKAGYDSLNKLYLALPPGFRSLPRPTPSKEAAVEAYANINNLLRAFLWADKASRANAMGCILGMAARKLIDANYPLIVVNAPGGATKGQNGKTLLCHVISGIVFGQELAVNPWPRGESALRKQLMTNFQGSQPATIFDNLPTDGLIDLGPLNLLLTSPFIRDRAMGQSQNIFADLRGHQILATGNGLKWRAESARRCIDIFLTKPPENHVFETPFLKEFVLEHASEMSAWVLTILESWLFVVKRDNPPGEGQTPIIKSFERWSSTTGSMMSLCDAGEHYLTNFGDSAVKDESSNELAFIDAIYGVYGSKWFTAGGMWKVVEESGPLHKLLPRSLLDLVHNTKKDRPGRAVSSWLQERVGSHFGDMLIERNPRDNRDHLAQFRVIRKQM